MTFDPNFTEQVRNSVNIVDLIGGYVHLKKSGQNFSARCPFHSEKTPSFLVSETKQIFKCFGCGLGGDVFKFVEQIENLTFPEAIRFLAERSGIPVPTNSFETARSVQQRSNLQEIVQVAHAWFRQNLEAGHEGAEYLRERKIDRETVNRFELGYAPPGSQLFQFLTRKGYKASDIELTGLISTGTNGQYYDKFRSRLIFPICNLNGKPIAFGGRILGDGRPKYLNSPETPLYHKGNHLYGLNLAREAIRQRDFAILVEGYFDCIVPSQFGIRNVVASLGTGLTEGQVKLLGRYTKNVIVNFDPDTAGLSAAMRSINLFLAAGLRVNVLRLPDGEDPDSFILANGQAAYVNYLKESQPYLDFLLGHFLEQEGKPLSPKSKQQVVDQILPYVLKVPNRIERSEYLSRIASRLQINVELLMSELRRLARVNRRQPSVEVRALRTEITPSEEQLLTLLLEGIQTDYIFSQLELNLIEGLRTTGLFKGIFELKNQNLEISVIRLRGLIAEEDRELLEHIALSSRGVEGVSQEAVDNCIDALREKLLVRMSQQVQDEIAREEKSGVTSPRLNELLREKERVSRQRRRHG